MEWIVTPNRRSRTPLHIDTSLVRTHMENFLFGIFCKISETNNQPTHNNRFIVITIQGKDSDLASGQRPHSLSGITNGS